VININIAHYNFLCTAAKRCTIFEPEYQKKNIDLSLTNFITLGIKHTRHNQTHSFSDDYICRCTSNYNM